jgi:pimeloyl-ACP methyl ester carboxylesterase
MVGDATRILDSYGIVAPHFVGLSMGGLVAQLVAVQHRARVVGRTVISSSLSLPGRDRINCSRVVDFTDSRSS